MAKPKRHAKAKRKGYPVGRISMTRKGYGFVATPGGDVYVAIKDTAGAMHGDTVAVRVQSARGGKGASGVVMKVMERANDTIVGRYEEHGGIGIVVPTDARIKAEVFVQKRDAGGATDGDIVVVHLTAFPSRSQAAQGGVTEVLGRPGTPGIEIEIIIREHGLRTKFPSEVEEAAEAITLGVDAEIAAGREDLRDVFTVTIDPVDARDFDDAISIEHVDGLVRMGVHIADVSHYVPWGSAIDEEARKRATSVYLVDRVLPMLPEHLSNNICSLNPGVERLAFSVIMDLDNDGVVRASRIVPSVIRSNHRLDYGAVDTMLETGKGFPDKDAQELLTEFARIAGRIGVRRVARGGLDFETVEAKVMLDDEDNPIEVVLRERTVATNMIEESAILANEVVAQHMTAAQAPMIYRIHEEPKPDALGKVAIILKEFDYPIKDIHGASPQTFQRIVKFASERPEKRLINSLLLRALQRARYVDYLGPHFGLASEAYTHFTSPIRRYPDLIVHRLLRAQLAGKLGYKPASEIAPELEWLTEHCSVMEREAEAASSASVRVKLAQLMQDHVGEVFSGIITSVMSFGMFVQLDNTAEGLVHVQALTDDYYSFDPERFMLIGESNGRVFRLGERIDVRVLDVSISEGRIDFELA